MDRDMAFLASNHLHNHHTSFISLPLSFSFCLFGPTQETAKRKPILFWQYAVFYKALKSINAAHLSRKRTQFASLERRRYLCSARTEPQPVASLLTTP